ncbi:MAG: TonB-dependent receptor plug domain-containing protein [Candidatus Kapaibacteriota bacterium]
MKFLFWAYLCISLWGFIANAADTVETKVTTEVLVESNKEQFWKAKSLSYERVFIADSNKFFFNSTSEILSFVPGIYIRDFGGIGGIKTISLRGFASTDVGILLDGCRINSQQNGVVDLNLVPLELFDEIGLVRGGASFQYGNNSASGLVNFSFINNPDKNIKLSFGSFEQIKFSGNLPFRLNNIYTGNLGLFAFSSTGDYPFEISEFGKLRKVRRENSKVKTLSVLLNNQIDFSRIYGKINIFYTYSNRGVPGAVVQNLIENKNAKLIDNSIFFSTKILPYSLDTNIQVHFKTFWQKNEYYDPKINLLLIRKETAEYNNLDVEFKILFQRKIFNFQTASYIEWNIANLSGDFLQPTVNKFVQRKNFAVGFGFDKLLLTSPLLTNLEFNIRFDAISKIKPVLVYSFGLSIDDSSTKSRANVNFSKNFRLPTFNELYFLNYGNQNLRPETTFALNVELYNQHFSFFQPKLMLFYYSTDDKIISIPKSTVQWTAMNVARTINTGFEVSLSTQTQFFNLLFSYSFTKAIDKTTGSPTIGKQLIYTPTHIANFVLNIPLPYKFSITSKSLYVGDRYALPDNSTNSKLSRYHLFDIAINKEIFFENYNFFVSFEVYNILNFEYEIILNYPMPGRIFMFTLSTNF